MAILQEQPGLTITKYSSCMALGPGEGFEGIQARYRKVKYFTVWPIGIKKTMAVVHHVQDGA
jgi:hypothetical protein